VPDRSGPALDLSGPFGWLQRTNHNPSLIGNDEYGFHPFAREKHGEGGWYDSFPSGHTTRTVAIAAVYWVAYPRWRWLGVLATAAVVVGLIGMNYHFVGDTVAGAFVGGLVGVYAAHFARLTRTTELATPPPIWHDPPSRRGP